ncbi:hypothetical protein SARC_07689 [Sphaeroforma arctica JP610]|uniref:Rab-GAP TBC domain-containing protein n=1 Tax=Sphaeroforma arctica JP610 TaxID=667725 RepID=A0A0L0FTC3_9EUKA|nr:hypothetical protein SARC_07689 [Sphaeroforma arctica JP610]KNC79929.1 hypothetical protein SARC_07689 [Sphaeroforma arctica JP610]|eukprot:XP_014153831.1 hypothetical protein SARC_07689 [Sphaeroforma arctica JP610]
MTSAYASKWFLQCFLDKLPFGVVIRLWDCFLLEGYTVIQAIALSIIISNKKRLMKGDFEKILNFLSSEMSNSEVNTKALFRSTTKYLAMLKKVDRKQSRRIKKSQTSVK